MAWYTSSHPIYHEAKPSGIWGDERYISKISRGHRPRDILTISNEEIIPSEISHTSRGACLLAIISAICQECKSLFKRTFTLQIGLLHLLVLVKYTVLHSVKLYIFTSYFKQSVKVYFEGLLRFLRDFYAFWVTFTLFEGLLRFF